MPTSRRLTVAGLCASTIVGLQSVRSGAQSSQLLEGPVPDLPPTSPTAADYPVPAAVTPPERGWPPTAAAPEQTTAKLPTWRRNAILPPPLDGRPAITVIVDDMGWMHPHTERAVALPGPLTLAWFPFAPRLPEQVASGTARGHEAMLHMPMQSNTNSILQTGPDPLRIDLAPAVNLARLRAAIEAVPGTVGLNNHMGTVATRDTALMAIVASETRDRGMLFLDSITIPHSVALSCAEAAGVPAAGRDVFIDYKMDVATIRGQFEQIEAMARRHGHCIAIGHPRELTLDALEAWLPTLARKGFALWPISATVAWRNNIDVRPSHSA